MVTHRSARLGKQVLIDITLVTECKYSSVTLLEYKAQKERSTNSQNQLTM